MKVVLRTLSDTPAGVAALEQEFDVETLTIGGGTDNNIQLSGVSVPLHHSMLIERADGVYVRPLEVRVVKVNGFLEAEHRLQPGDVIAVGPHEIRVVDPPAGVRLALELKERPHAPATGPSLIDRTHMGVERGLFTRRKLSWLAVAATVAVALAAPIVASRMKHPLPPGPIPPPETSRAWSLANLSWSTGTVSRAHAQNAANCAACHAVPFQPVRDQECQSCHAKTGRHVRADGPEPAALQEQRCAQCHPEHRGEAALIDRRDAFCTSCHDDLARWAKDTKLENVGCFNPPCAHPHPEFRPRVATKLGVRECERVKVTTPPPPPTPLTKDQLPKEEPLLGKSGLKFAHAIHMQENLRTTWRKPQPGVAAETKTLECTDCHVLDAGNNLMRQITFEQNCRSCHDLAFSLSAPEREVRHGLQPAQVAAEINDFIVARVIDNTPPPNLPQPLFVLAGAGSIDDGKRQELRSEARKAAQQATDDLMGPHRTDGTNVGACDVCHTFNEDRTIIQPVHLAGDPDRCAPKSEERLPTWRGPRPEEIASRWMPLAIFSHRAHLTVTGQKNRGDVEGCRVCHVVDSAAGPTGMLPSRDVCAKCHRAGPGGAEKAVDACVECHEFHIDRYGPIHGPAPTTVAVR